MKNVSRTALVLSFAAALMGCQKKATAPSATTPDVSDTVLQLKKSVQSVGSSFGSSAVASGVQLRVATKVDDSGLDTSICGDHGYPLNKDSSNPRWALERYYCMISTDDGSEETLPGAFTSVYQFACALNGLVKYDGVQREIVAPIDPTCFGKSIANEMARLNITSVKLVATGSVPSTVQPGIWQQSLEFEVSPNDPNVDKIGEHYFNVYTKRSATEISFATTSGVKSVNQRDAFAVNLDLSTGKIRFEEVNQRYDADPSQCDSGDSGCVGWNRHTRLVATGTIDQNGLFSDVKSLEGAIGEISKSNGNTYASLTTAKGSQGLGWRSHSYSTGGGDISLAASFQENGVADGYCYSGGAALDCAGNDGIKLSADADTAFLILPTSTYDATAWGTSASAYLGFNSVQLVEIQ